MDYTVHGHYRKASSGSSGLKSLTESEFSSSSHSNWTARYPRDALEDIEPAEQKYLYEEPSNGSKPSPHSSAASLNIQRAVKWINSQLSPTRSRRPSNTGFIPQTPPLQSTERLPQVILTGGTGVSAEPVTPTSKIDGVEDKEDIVIRSLASPVSGSFALSDEAERCKRSMARMRKRHNCIRELYSTEYQFAQDMAVVVRLYMCASADIGLSVGQIEMLFSNVSQVLDISLSLVAILEARIPTQILQGDGTISSADVRSDSEIRAGEAMCLALNGQLYQVYEDYIHHSREQLELYYTLTQYMRRNSPRSHDSGHSEFDTSNIDEKKVSAWLNHCGSKASKFTTAWSLDSLLIKPVQRLGKYPLFLQVLLDYTDESHGDYCAIERALHRSRHYLDCVNARFRQIET